MKNGKRDLVHIFKNRGGKTLESYGLFNFKKPTEITNETVYLQKGKEMSSSQHGLLKYKSCQAHVILSYDKDAWWAEEKNMSYVSWL